VGLVVGSLSVGLILQKKILNHFTVMGLGALCIFTGLMVTFPPQSFPAMYKITPITAFAGVFIAGVGDPLMTIATLRALYNTQV
jgi:1,4-dihydroxy-2-naphthoate octaprenyltransferase